MTDWTIYVVSPPAYQHAAVFNDVALGLQGAFTDLGYSCHATSNIKEVSGRCVALGANLCHEFKEWIPDDAIVFNLELANTSWMVDPYLDLMRKHETWDYSPSNIKYLADHGIDAKLCRIGYHPCLARIKSAVCTGPYKYDPEDIDVLFYGSNTWRRMEIMRDMWNDGVRIYGLFGAYGAARDDYIARAKVVVNIHSWDTASLFEIVRMQLLFANAKCVLTEVSRPDDVEWQSYRGCMAEADRDGMSEVAKHLLGDETLRRQLGQVGFNTFKAHPQSRYLADVLGLADTDMVDPKHQLAL